MRRWHLPRPVAFWMLVLTILLFLATSSVPSPLYPLYRERWDFSVTILTVIFAIYVAALLITLLTAGSLSDHLGRRPVLIGALVLEAVSTAVFLTAEGVPALLIARVLQGVATGAAVGAVSAGLVDLSPRRYPNLGTIISGAASTTGLAIGTGVTGVLVQLSDHPDGVIFAVLTTTFTALAILAVFLPDTRERGSTPMSSLRPKIALPRYLRPAFLGVAPVVIAAWMLSGLYLSLASSLAVVFGPGAGATGGLVSTAMFLASATGSMTTGRLSYRTSVILGSSMVAAGAAGTVLALSLGIAPLFFIAAAVGGYGNGTAFNGSLRFMSRASRPTERAQVFSAVYIVSYTAFAGPALIAGLIEPAIGLSSTALAYAAAIVISCLVAALVAIRRDPDTRMPSAEDRAPHFQD